MPCLPHEQYNKEDKRFIIISPGFSHGRPSDQQQMIPALASHRNETGIKRMRGEGSSSEAREAVNRKSLHSNALCILFPYFLFF